jgi:hypothetical protein
MKGLRLPFLVELETAGTVLVAGAGGGFDVFSGLPLYFALRDSGKRVHLANLSFTNLDGVEGRRLAPAVVEVKADTRHLLRYFPEFYLSQWFREVGQEVPIYCFERTGFRPLRDAYQAVVDELKPDAIVLVDGGTDSLMCGDEAGLGTPEEDMASIAAVDDLPGVNKYLVCVGFGVDSFHGVCHEHCLEAVADLTRRGGYLGAFSLLAEMIEVKLYREATLSVFRAMPDHPSIVSSSIFSALDGHYGNHHATERTRGSTLWINPLMPLYWCFQLAVVAQRIKYLAAVKASENYFDLMALIDGFREGMGTTRPRSVIPDASMGRRTRR